MWRMLCAAGKDLHVDVSDVRADDTGGHAHWEARYTFPATGRAVVNVVDDPAGVPSFPLSGTFSAETVPNFVEGCCRGVEDCDP